MTSQSKYMYMYFPITRPVTAIFEGKKIHVACFYTISENASSYM